MAFKLTISNSSSGLGNLWPLRPDRLFSSSW